MPSAVIDPVLSMFAGEWIGDESIADTRWGAGGSASSNLSARFELGGKVLLMDYRSERDGKPALQAHAVFVAGPEYAQYQMHWFDSYGFVPAAPAMGHWDGQVLIFLRSSSRGQTRHIYLPEGPHVYRLTLESSFDGGIHWDAVMTGTYRRAT